LEGGGNLAGGLPKTFVRSVQTYRPLHIAGGGRVEGGGVRIYRKLVKKKKGLEKSFSHKGENPKGIRPVGSHPKGQV